MSKDAWKRFGDDGYKHYEVVECGFKYNMMDLQACIGLEQLKKIQRFRQARQTIWDSYNDAFASLPIGLPAPVDPETEHAYHLYTIRVDPSRTGISRDRFLGAMTARNIGVGVHYASLTEHPYYQRTFGWRPEDTPEATAIGRSICSLPISPALTSSDVEDVIAAVTEILSEHSTSSANGPPSGPR
jgi:dTDP-4-amino-4,6-dideoxygalactose transaminase